MTQKKDAAGERDLTRRAFLKSTAAVGAGLAVAAPRIIRAETLGAERLNVGFIGVGTQGQRLLKDCLKMSTVRFRGVCDIWDRNREYMVRLLGKYKKYGHDAEGYVDYREMLAKVKDLDAVIIATPDWVHAEQTIAALKAGLHVYCEKEMSNDLAQAKAMVLTARETGKRLQIGHQRRSNPRYHVAKDFLDNKRVCGPITHVYGQWNRGKYLTVPLNPKMAMDPARLKQYGYGTMERLRNWRYYRQFSGGTIADLGSHQIDVFNWFLRATPRAVMANGGVDHYDEKLEWYDNIVALYEWDYEFDGRMRTARGHYQACSTSAHGGFAETFMGPDGSLTISEMHDIGCIRREHDAEPMDPKADWEKKLDSEKKQKIAEAIAAAGRGEPADKRKGPGQCNCMVGPTQRNVNIRHYLPVPGSPSTITEHSPHLENFFAAVRDSSVALNCPGEVGYETAVSVLRANEAMQAGRRLEFKPEDFEV